jgi:hypothetical protein
MIIQPLTYNILTNTGSTPTPNPPAPYVRPADWIDISEVGDNEINLLVTETTGLAFSVVLPSGTYSIDWGDGNTTTGCSSGTIYQYQHTTGGTWSDEGYYTWKVRIFNASSTITRWQVRRHTYTIRQHTSPILWANFGTTGITDYTNAFYDPTNFDTLCYLLQEAQIPSFTNCVSTSNMFYDCLSLRSVTLPTSWGSVTGVSYMFYECYALTSITLPTSWSSVENVSYMFYNCFSLNSITLPILWGSVTNVSYMFQSCYTLTSINLPTSWGSVTGVSFIFFNCRSLDSINLPTSWGNVTNVTGMFYGCYDLRSVTLPTSWGSILYLDSMFHSCYGLSSVTLPTSWGSVNSVNNMFNNCFSLNSITLPILWSSVENVSYMFYNCISLNSITLPILWGNVINVSYMFQYCYTLSSVTLPTSWGNVINVSYMFQNCYSLNSITLPTSWGNVTNVTGMFSSCYGLSSINLPTSWGSILYLDSMFYGGRALTSITLPTSWGSVTTATSMFGYCYSLTSITLPTSWGNVTNVSNMFLYCYGLKTIINTEYLGTTGATQCDMTDTFQYCDFLSSELNIASRLTKIGAYGASGYVMKLTSIRLTNSASTFTGTSPQINVSYTSLGKEGLDILFDDIPSGLLSKTINITGVIGNTTVTKTCGIVSGSTTMTCTNTSSLVPGMEMTGTGLSSARSVTFQDSGDTVTLANHGLTTGMTVSFSNILTTTGIVRNTPYYVISPTTSTFQVSLTQNGAALPLTSNGSGSLITVPKIVSINPNVSIIIDKKAWATNSSTSVSFTEVQRSKILLKGWTITG